MSICKFHLHKWEVYANGCLKFCGGCRRRRFTAKGNREIKAIECWDGMNRLTSMAHHPAGKARLTKENGK